MTVKYWENSNSLDLNAQTLFGDEWHCTSNLTAKAGEQHHFNHLVLAEWQKFNETIPMQKHVITISI